MGEEAPGGGLPITTAAVETRTTSRAYRRAILQKIPLAAEVSKKTTRNGSVDTRTQQRVRYQPIHGYVAFIDGTEAGGAAMPDRVSEQVTDREGCAGCVKPVRLLHAPVQYSAPHPARTR